MNYTIKTLENLLKEAFENLKLTEEEINSIKNENYCNNVLLYGSVERKILSEIQQNQNLQGAFKSVGIKKLVEMIDVVTSSLHYHLNNYPLQLEKVISFCIDYWENSIGGTG